MLYYAGDCQFCPVCRLSDQADPLPACWRLFRQDYIRTARAKGVSERTVIWKHALRNALIPVVTLIGMQTGAVIAGSAIIEAVHSFPGMGSLMMTAINNKDYNTIQAVVLLLSGVVCLINLAVDIIYVAIDPRVKTKR